MTTKEKVFCFYFFFFFKNFSNEIFFQKKKKKKSPKGWDIEDDLGGVWILYSKQLSWISMHKMHSKKNTTCLVGILTNAKCILRRMHFANSQF